MDWMQKITDEVMACDEQKTTAWDEHDKCHQMKSSVHVYYYNTQLSTIKMQNNLSLF